MYRCLSTVVRVWCDYAAEEEKIAAFQAEIQKVIKTKLEPYMFLLGRTMDRMSAEGDAAGQ